MHRDGLRLNATKREHENRRSPIMPLDVAVGPTTLTSTLYYLKRGAEKPAELSL